MKKIALFACALVAISVAACSASAPPANTKADAPIGAYVQRDGYVEIYAPGEGGADAKPLMSLTVQESQKSGVSDVHTEMMAGGWCCTNCYLYPEGDMICMECHSCK